MRPLRFLIGLVLLLMLSGFVGAFWMLFAHVLGVERIEGQIRTFKYNNPLGA